MPQAIFEWHAREYDHNPKSADWYWAIGIIATALVITAVLFSNYLLAVLVIVGTVTVMLHAARHPPVHRFAVIEQGVLIDNDLHPFEHIHSFSMLEYIEGDRPPVLSLKTESWFTPHLLIPLHEVDVDALYAYLLTRVHEKEHPHTLHDLVAAWLGF